nr:hypothetical protein GCM10020092_048210 [Actinoplanes digitatis]
MGYRNLLPLRAGPRRGAGIVVELEGRELVGTPVDDPAPGSEVMAGIRPEDLRIGPADGAGVLAVVEVVEYQGREVAVEARTEGGVPLNLRAADRPSGRRPDHRHRRTGAAAGVPRRRWAMTAVVDTARPALRHRLAERGVDRQLLLLIPAALFVVTLFIYPFLYGLGLSFQPVKGGPLGAYREFFTDAYLRDTIATTLGLALPAALLNVLASVPIAYRMRGRFRG